MGWLSAVARVAGGLFGAKSSKDEAKQAYYDNKRTVLNQPGWVRKGAEAAGFNPLTVLGAGGMQTGFNGGGGGAAPLASIDMIVGGLREASDELTGQAALDRQAQELETDLLRLQVEKLAGTLPALKAAPGVADLGKKAVAATPVKVGGVPVASRVRPRARPTLYDKGMAPFFYMDGVEGHAPLRALEAAGVKPWGVLTGGARSEYLGDELGELTGIDAVPGGKVVLDGGLLSRNWSDAAERAQRAEDAASPLSLLRSLNRDRVLEPGTAEVPQGAAGGGGLWKDWMTIPGREPFDLRLY